MAYDEHLAERIRAIIRRRKGFEEKKMFGGLGFLLNGNMCVGVWKESLVVRFSKQDHDDVLLEQHVRPFDITGKAMTGWALVDPSGLLTDAELKAWVDRAIKFVRTLPAK